MDETEPRLMTDQYNVSRKLCGKRIEERVGRQHEERAAGRETFDGRRAGQRQGSTVAQPSRGRDCVGAGREAWASRDHLSFAAYL